MLSFDQTMFLLNTQAWFSAPGMQSNPNPTAPLPPNLHPGKAHSTFIPLISLKLQPRQSRANQGHQGEMICLQALPNPTPTSIFLRGHISSTRTASPTNFNGLPSRTVATTSSLWPLRLEKCSAYLDAHNLGSQSAAHV